MDNKWKIKRDMKKNKSDKRGQFYLIAAIVIIAIIIGFATITNSFKKGSVDEKKVYFLSNELDTEGAYVIDYSVFKSEDVEKKLIEFTSQYGQYAGEDREIYFVFGNKNKIMVASYEEITSGTISVEGGGSGPILQLIKEKGFKKSEISPGGKDKVTIKIKQEGKDVNYDFELKPGENFYFVISQDIPGRGRIVLDKPSKE